MTDSGLFQRRRSEDVSINLTPLIDVVFILLIFFMVTTTFQRQTELDVDLPSVTSQADAPATERVDLVIDAAGRIAIDGRTLVDSRPETIRRGLSDSLEPGSEQVVVLTTDRETPSGAILPVLQVIGAMGHERVAFAAQADPDTAGEP